MAALKSTMHLLLWSGKQKHGAIWSGTVLAVQCADAVHWWSRFIYITDSGYKTVLLQNVKMRMNSHKCDCEGVHT